jgi:ATP-binding cassette subfamily B protein
MLPVLQLTYASWATIYGSRAPLRDTLDLLDQPLPDFVKQPQGAALSFKSEIQLKQLGFRYTSDGPWVLKNVNLAMPKGGRIGFIGKTGGGKSTLLDIVMGLLSPTDGSMEVDGVPINAVNQRAWQASIAHVPQMIFLTDSSVAENIAFGLRHEQIDMGRVRYAAQQAQIAELVESWPGKYETVVGERGIKLSGGQRQRLAIARALYKDAPILILDEATSALDTESEQAVQVAIKALTQNRTSLIIAHRLSTIHHADRIIMMNSGRIVESGTHTLLMAQNGAYANLYRLGLNSAPT